MSTKTLFTVEEFLQLPEMNNDEGENPGRYELDEGELIDMGETTYRHNWIRAAIYEALASFLKTTRLGVVLTETGVKLNTGSWRRADILYWDATHVSRIDPDRSPIDVIPQLVVEVVSPSNTFKGLLDKAAKYQCAGVHTVWIVNGDPLEIHVFEGTARRVVRAGEMLTSELLLGFAMDASVVRFT